MGIDYDARAAFGWEIDEENENKFRQVLKEVFNIKGSEEFSFWQGDQVENMDDIIQEQLGLPFSLTLTGNFYCDEAEAYILLFGKRIEGKKLDELNEWVNANKETLKKIEEIMGEPPYFGVQYNVW